jgi:hypothetical protein
MKDYFFLISFISIGILLIRCGLKGLRYDNHKKIKDPSYKNSYFWGFQGINVPWKIEDNTNDIKLQDLKKEYNSSVRLFWTLVIGVLGVFFYLFN